MEVLLKIDNKSLPTKNKVANQFFSRLFGLMGKKSISKEETLIFPNCNSIHTFFMRFPIDVVFVSKNGEVVKIFSSLKPWRLLLPVSGAKHTIEMASGVSETLGIKKGSQLNCEGIWN